MAETAQDVDTPKGTVVAGRYEVERLIARGGMAAVYLARQIRLNRKVAIKILTPPTAEEDSELFEERFRLEAETLAALSHPNIVVLYDYGDLDDGRVFLAMEYIDGLRLTDILKDGPLPWERTLTLVGQIVRALRYAHKLGVVHRDLKPSNLLICEGEDGGECVKVVDFGLVKLTEGDQNITRAGLILGSPHCMSPEQVKGADIDHRTDIYAIGVLLFRCLTGSYPFHGTNSTATMIEHLHADIPTFLSVNPNLKLPEGIEEIVRRCLRKQAGERYASASELLDAIRSCMSSPPDSFNTTSHTAHPMQPYEVTAPITLNPAQPIPANRSLVPLLAGVFGVGLALLIVGGGALIWVLTHRPPPYVEPAKPVPVVVAPVQPAPRPVPIEPAPEPPKPVQPVPVEITPKPRPVRPRPVKPRPIKPRPVKPRPVRPKPTPKPDPVPQPAPVEPKQPPGYLGLPDDI